jgi:hypothetical protein
MFIDSRNKLVHRTGDIPGWSLESPPGRIAALGFLKFLQAFNVQLRGILTGLVLSNGEKPFEGLISREAIAPHELWPEAEIDQQPATGPLGLEGPA